jgi:hypothetical protein
MDKVDTIKFKIFCPSKDIKWRDKPQNGRKFLQIIYLIRDLYLEYAKSFFNSIIKNNPIKSEQKI